MRKLAVLLSIIAVALLIFAVLAEIYLRRAPDTFWGFSDISWELRFLDAQANSPCFIGGHGPHPTRGWTPQPNLSQDSFSNNIHMQTTTNDRGHRASPNYVYQPDKFTILVAGDSFTWGFGVDDKDVWPALLQGLEPRFHVLNLGVGGYGMDQMYITLRETIAEYKPQLVIFAYITDDLERCTLSFRDYRKPKFVLGKDNELILTNTPIGDEKETVQYVKSQLALPHLMLATFIRNRFFSPSWHTPPYWAGCMAIGKRIAEEAQKVSEAQQAQFLLAHLSCGMNLSDPNCPDDQGEDFLKDYANTHHVATFESREPFLKSGRKWGEQHYDDEEAKFLAKALLDKIKELESWHEYCNRK